MALMTSFRAWLSALVGRPVRPPAQPPAPRQGQPSIRLVSPSDVFTPTRPRAGRRTLVGRQKELRRIVDALLDEHAHVVLYSERGRGKTSLSNLVVESLRRRGAIVGRHACGASSTFETVMRGLARDLPPSLLASHEIGSASEGCGALLPARALVPGDIAALPAQLNCPCLVFVVDEFDRILDVQTRTLFADTIKLLSDRGIRMFFMLVGVSTTLGQILGQHPSIQRNIIAVHLPLLTEDDIGEMMIKGGTQSGVAFTDDATSLVVQVARGMPYMAQLLGLRITQVAAARVADTVCQDDLVAAVERLLDETDPDVVTRYEKMVGGEPGLKAELRKLGSADQDKWARVHFQDADSHVVAGTMRFPAAAWAVLLKNDVIARSEGEAGTAQILDRPLMYYVQLLAAHEDLVLAAHPPPQEVSEKHRHATQSAA